MSVWQHFHVSESETLGQRLDHWINQYLNSKEDSWVNLDANFLQDEDSGLDQYDIPMECFDWSAKVWLDIRRGKEDLREIDQLAELLLDPGEYLQKSHAAPRDQVDCRVALALFTAPCRRICP